MTYVDVGLHDDEDILIDVLVSAVELPAGSSIGFGWGTRVDDGVAVRFVGDHGPMLDLLRAHATGLAVAAVPLVMLKPGGTAGFPRFARPAPERRYTFTVED
jgi:hypothetical protein